VVDLPRWQKRQFSIAIDVIGLLFIAVFAIWLRLGGAEFSITSYVPAILLLPLVSIPAFIRFGLYRAVVRYISHRFVFVVFSAVSLSFILWASAIFMLDLAYPRSALVIAWFIALVYITGTRLLVRWWLLKNQLNVDFVKNVVIYGAGESGRQLMQAMDAIKDREVVAFIDDDKQLRHHKIGSVKVYGSDEVEDLIERLDIQEILLAIPSLKASQRKEILTQLEVLPVKVSTLPPIDEIVDGKVSFSDVREVDIADLLGRDVVPPKLDLLEQCIKDQVVLVSGAGGSIGSELCRQVIKQSPKQLILYELSEFALYEIDKELAAFDVEVVAILGSVLNEVKLKSIIEKYQVSTIYHAAAYKHVPIVEHNIEEGILNNSFGTLSIAKVAAEKGVRNFVLISTDKAVRPTNFMGASKRLAEMVLQALQVKYPDTRFVMVRFGNVLGSSGSVIPLFRKQIAEGGPVTVTHKEITRFFMTIPEAASLVIQAGSMGSGGDVYVLDMGVPVKIVDLARKVIQLSGLTVMDETGEGDIEIQFTGLRPGEKLYEELLIGDNVSGTEHPRIMKAFESFISYEELIKSFERIKVALEKKDFVSVQSEIQNLVDGFNHTSGIVDYLNISSSD